MNKLFAKLFFICALAFNLVTYSAQVSRQPDTVAKNNSPHMAPDDQWHTFITFMHTHKKYRHEEYVGYDFPLNGYIFRLECTPFDKKNHLKSNLFRHGIYLQDEYFRNTAVNRDALQHPSQYEELTREQLLQKARSLNLPAPIISSFQALLEVLEVNLEISHQRRIYPNKLEEWINKREELRKREFKEE